MSSLFQMWPMQTRQPESLEGTRSSSPLRRYFPPCCVCADSALICFGSSCWYSPADPPSSSSSTRVRRCWRSRASLVVNTPPPSSSSSLYILEAMISVDERRCWTFPSHRCDHWWVGFLSSPPWWWHHQSGAAGVLQRQLPGKWRAPSLRSSCEWFVDPFV